LSSELSDATLSRLTPATTLKVELLLLLDPPGVCGGVNKGRGPEALEPAAVMEGTLLIEGVGLFMTGTAFWSGTCAKLDCVAAAGGGAIVPLLLFDWFESWRAIIAGTAGIVVGVACGVDAAELALATEMGVGVCRAMLGGG
jgi:hypothetical protein